MELNQTQALLVDYCIIDVVVLLVSNIQRSFIITFAKPQKVYRQIRVHQYGYYYSLYLYNIEPFERSHFILYPYFFSRLLQVL